MAAARAKGSYTQAQYGRLAPRRGKRKARKAVGHTLLVGIWHMLTNNVTWDDLDADYFDKRRSATQAGQRKLGDLKSMGWTLPLRSIQQRALATDFAAVRSKRSCRQFSCFR